MPDIPPTTGGLLEPDELVVTFENRLARAAELWHARGGGEGPVLVGVAAPGEELRLVSRAGDAFFWAQPRYAAALDVGHEDITGDAASRFLGAGLVVVAHASR